MGCRGGGGGSTACRRLIPPPGIAVSRRCRHSLVCMQTDKTDRPLTEVKILKARPLG